MNTFKTRCFRIMLGIKRLDRVSNQQIYETTSSSPLMTTVTLRQLKFLGHILRMDKNELIYIYVCIFHHMASDHLEAKRCLLLTQL